jgi:hypothetical protein
MQGWAVAIINADGHDMVAIKDGVTLRVQSKATQRPCKSTQYQWSCSMGKPKRPLTKADTDLVAFVALDVRRCMFVPVEEIDQQITWKNRVADLYIPTIESDTLGKASHYFCGS